MAKGNIMAKGKDRKMDKSVADIFAMGQANFKIICCIMPRGDGEKLNQRLINDFQITSTHIHGCKGASDREVDIREVDFVETIVAADKADEVFNFIYDELKIAEKSGALIFQHALHTSSNPELVPQEATDGLDKSVND